MDRQQPEKPPCLEAQQLRAEIEEHLSSTRLLADALVTLTDRLQQAAPPQEPPVH